MKYQIAYINVYGNAKVLANEIMNILPEDNVEEIDLSYQEITDDADVYLIGFEITSAAIPLKIMDVLEKLDGKTIICFATHSLTGFESKESIEKKFLPFLPAKCDYRGLFCCLGQIPVNVLVSIEEITQEHPDRTQAAEALESCRKSMDHPDIEDIRSLRLFIQKSGI